VAAQRAADVGAWTPVRGGPSAGAGAPGGGDAGQTTGASLHRCGGVLLFVVSCTTLENSNYSQVFDETAVTGGLTS